MRNFDERASPIRGYIGRQIGTIDETRVHLLNEGERNRAAEERKQHKATSIVVTFFWSLCWFFFLRCTTSRRRAKRLFTLVTIILITSFFFLMNDPRVTTSINTLFKCFSETLFVTKLWTRLYSIFIYLISISLLYIKINTQSLDYSIFFMMIMPKSVGKIIRSIDIY